ncbi:hypothetical protein TNCV_2156951 [Trichonephila clavipes]|nr:hypothetical protein TNCV_2156951 [Trichonephila clavipes]
MSKLGKTRPLPGHSSIGSISPWHASTHHGVQQGRQCVGHLANTRQGAYLEYTRNIEIQHQGVDPMGLWSGREKKKWDDKKRVENREGSLEYPGFVTPVFTKDSKPLGKRKRSLGHLGIVIPVLI